MPCEVVYLDDDGSDVPDVLAVDREVLRRSSSELDGHVPVRAFPSRQMALYEFSFLAFDRDVNL